jgi:putative flippase GtrA
MQTFIKAQASSIISTFFDLVTTVVCKEFFYFWYVIASLIGTLVGGTTNFALGRGWVFNRKEKKIPKQAVKYFIIWNGNLLLSTLGVFVVTHYIGLSYFYSKLIVSVIVGVGYNYLLQKKFVFA